MAALSGEVGWRRGRRRISGKRLRTVETLKSKGMSNRATAHRMGVTDNAIRKLVGPSTGTTLAIPVTGENAPTLYTAARERSVELLRSCALLHDAEEVAVRIFQNDKINR